MDLCHDDQFVFARKGRSDGDANNPGKGGSGFAAVMLRFLNATAVRKHAEREAASCRRLTLWQETVSGTAAQNGVCVHELE